MAVCATLPMTQTLRFEDLGLIAPLARAVARRGLHANPRRSRPRAIPHVLAGRDLLGLAQTGTGKTAAFALPILQRLAADRPPPARRPPDPRPRAHADARARRADRRELRRPTASTSRCARGDLRRRRPGRAGAARSRSGIDILVATPGRLLDLVQQRLVDLRQLEVFVLDEADRMLDMGFIHDVRRVIAHAAARRARRCSSRRRCRPRRRSSPIGCCATRRRVAVAPVVDDGRDGRAGGATSSRRPTSARCSSHVLRDAGDDARARLHAHQARRQPRRRAPRARRGIGADAIHGNKSQNARERALARFKARRDRACSSPPTSPRAASTSTTSSHVINFDLPERARDATCTASAAPRAPARRASR